MIKPSLFALIGTLAVSNHALVHAQAKDDDFSLEVETFGGRAVVPPDIIEADVDQSRLEGVIGGAAIARFKIDDTRLFARAGAEVFPVENLFNRYAIGVGVSQDIPITQDGRITARVGVIYDHVIGEEGRVFNRGRGDAQLIVRHGGGHTTVGRARYGYRDQSEERFTGFDQSEFLGELRHTWRKSGSDTSLSVAVFVLDIDAQDDRFSHRGLGARIIARTPLTGKTVAFGRASYVNRDYEAPFSAQFPALREDDAFRISGGVEQSFSPWITGFTELGYIDTASNVPTRDFQGAIGRVGVRIKVK